jgi:NADPH:quinone reductase-like Zn-dependent oxidoreductase
MRAMILRSYGGPADLQLSDVPRPTPGPGQLLLRVLAHSVNPIDWKLASGKLRPLFSTTFPHIPGFDVAGEVVELGAGVADYRVGDRVHARIDHAPGGACAEYAVAGTDVSAPIPAGMDAGEAAGLPLAGMTALQGLRDRLGLPMSGAKARVLIVGASGGVGHLAVQIARAAGATVVGVCSGRNAELVRSLGAHEIIDYTKPDAWVNQGVFDLVYDCVGGSPATWFPRMTPNGRFASSLPGPAVFGWAALNAVRARKVYAVMLKSNAADLRTLDALVTEGKLRVVVDSRFPLQDLRGAWERSMSGRAVGKIVVDVA